jgi:DNA repair exonuclease SbcCD ATPase subunit
MPLLTSRANHYLEILTDGDINVDFSTQREMKSSKGEYKDEICIDWTIEGASGYPPSGGQLKKIEIATDLALMDLAISNNPKTPDILCLDEILDGLDDKGVQRVLLLLQELRKKRSTIFVISHDDRMSEVFEKSIVIKKKKGTSCLEMR